MSLAAELPTTNEQHNSELIKSQEKILVKVKKCSGLISQYSSKTGHITTVARVEFGTTLLGESNKCDNDSVNGVTVYDFECALNVIIGDPLVQDDLVQTPIVVTVTEILPKDKKSKEERTSVTGQACIDLLPLVQGQRIVNGTYPLHPTGTSSELTAVPDQNLPEIEISLSVNEQLLSEDQLKSSNLMKICFESLYSLPESWNQSTAPQHMYLITLPMPVSAQKDVAVVVPNGIFRPAGEKEQNSQRRWCIAPTASGSSLYMPNSVVMKTSYMEEDGHLRSSEDVPFRLEAENEKARITWNVERRCFLSNLASESFMKCIAKQRFWPIEVSRTVTSQAVKGKSKGDEEILTSFHGVAYVDMAPLLYPGVKKIRGAYLIKPFTESELLEKTGRKTSIIDEAIKIISSTRSSSSIAHAKVPAGKLGKTDGKVKPSASVMKPPESVPETEAHESRKTEGQQYVDAKSYFVIEFQLETPLVAKREPDVLAKRISELIPPRPKFPKRQGGAKKAIEDFQAQIGITSKQMLEEFRKTFSAELADADGEERRKSEFLYHLNSSGKYFALKEQLKYFVVKIVREKYKNTCQFKNRDELQAFLSELYEFLLNQMHIGLNKYLITEEVAEIPPELKDAKTLKFFASEAEVLFDFERAVKYHQELLSLKKNEPDYWVDYACLCLYIGDTEKATECFKEAVSIDQKHISGLIMNGYMAVLQDRHEDAEAFFETATYCEDKKTISWTILGLYYAGIDNNIMAERAFNEAIRLTSADCPSSDGIALTTVLSEQNIDDQKTAEVNKTNEKDETVIVDNESTSKAVLLPKKSLIASETIFIQAARFLLHHRAVQFAERALSHELLSSGESALYFKTLAELQMYEKNYPDAKQNIDNSLKLEHQDADAWCLLGHLHFLTGQLDEAKESYERCLAYCNDPQDIHCLYLRLCSIYLKENEYSKAKDIYLKACTKKASCISWLGAGICSYKLNELSDAEHALNEANILDNHNSEVWAYLTLVCLKQNRHLEAEQCYRYAIKTGLTDLDLVNEIKRTMEQTNFDLSII